MMRQGHLRSPVLLGVLLLAGALLLPAAVQAQTAAGSIGGTVNDGTAPVPGVTITATNIGTGYIRTAVTAADGTFRLAALQVGTYTVKAELAGFATVTVEKVEVRVATNTTLDITMKLAKVAESVTVTAEVPLVEATPSVGTVVSQEQLESLPLNGRQFANLAVLAPGTALGYNTDPTKPGQLVVQLNGGTGRNVNYIMDGGDNTDDTIGGALQNFNLESVQEFKIQTMQYKAEYGRSSGGVLTVISKTGTNDFLGSAWGFFRRDNWDAKRESDILAGAQKSAFSRDQYGISFGGPIIKDKVHFFATFERVSQDAPVIVNSGGIDPGLDGTTYANPLKDDLVTAKVTYDVDASNYLQVRYGYQKNSSLYAAASSVAPNAVGNVSNKYSSILAGYTAQISADTLNEFVFQYTKFNNAIIPASMDPLIYYPTGWITGENFNAPQHTNQTKYQFKDDFSFSKTIAGKTHDFKAGLAFINEPTLGGDFTSGESGIYTLADGPTGGPQFVATDITYYGGATRSSTPTKQYSAYFQDDWKISSGFTLYVGLRYDYYDALYLDQRTNPVWQIVSSQTTYTDGYLADFKNGGGGIISNSKNGWAPRLGFSWDLSGDGKQVLRGGVGRYYDFPYINATILFGNQTVLSDYGIVYENSDTNGIRNNDGSFWQVGQPLPPNQVESSLPTELVSPTLKPPRSDQASLGFSWQATDWLGFTTEAVLARYRDLPFRFKFNPIDPATGDLRFPTLSPRVRMFYGKGFADYNGFNIGAHMRGEKFELQGFYTLSEVKGNVLGGADEFRISRVEYQKDYAGAVKDVSVDPLDPTCSGKCVGPLDGDARHRITLAGTYRLPAGFSVSGMFRYHSGTPYTVWAGTDLNGDGYALDLPPGVSHVNAARGASFSQFDLRLAKAFDFSKDIGLELFAEMFNIFNEKNPAVYIGGITASNFGQPTQYAGDSGQGEQRQVQLGLRVHF